MHDDIEATQVFALLSVELGATQARELLQLVKLSHCPAEKDPGRVSRADLAMALNVALFADLLERVPSGKAYSLDARLKGRSICLDHGALRTVRWFNIGALPPGEAAITRLLRPLGYVLNGTYPLPKLGMTGRSYVQTDRPFDIPQFFVSELHPEKFSPKFRMAVERVLQSSRDPLTPASAARLMELERDGALPFQDAALLLKNLVCCFDRQHEPPRIADYESIRMESEEMAWIATEGNTFNHVTDRVDDVRRVHEEQKALGRRIKDEVEVSRSARVLQTAFLADSVTRPFVADSGEIVYRSAPGSFYEFISRLPEPDSGKLDLGFDSGNAQAIFKMTAHHR